MKPEAALTSIFILLISCGENRTYSQGCGGLPEGWITPGDGRGEQSILNIVSVSDAGRLEFNGEPSSEPDLQKYLERTRVMNPKPVTQIKFASSVDCETVIRLRSLMSSNLDCTDGMCAEGAGHWGFIGHVGGRSGPYDAPEAASQNGG